MRFNKSYQSKWKFLKKINFGVLKIIFFFSSLLYFCIYFFYNIDLISLDINFEKNGINLSLAFLFCVLSIYLNAYAWKYIVKWFGEELKNNKNPVSFYVLTNVLKYVPGGIWHFVERFNFIKKISNPQIALYSTLIESYFMLCGSFLLASLGVIFSPLYLFLILPLVFLNRKLIYLVLKRLGSLKGKVFEVLRLAHSREEFGKINMISFFPAKALFLEIGFVLSKFIGFYICLNTFYSTNTLNIIYVLAIFSLSWSIGLVVPTAPSGVGVFEAVLLLFVGRNIPQYEILVSLIYFRIISTSADLLLSLPFLTRKLFKRI